MSPQVLNTLSYLMGLALMFNIGFFVGGYMQRRAIANTFSNGLQRVETFVSNLFKRGTNEKTQTDRNDPTADICGNVDFLNAEKEAFIFSCVPQDQQSRARKYMGIGEGADYQRTSQQGREGVSSETRREEGDCDRAGIIV